MIDQDVLLELKQWLENGERYYRSESDRTFSDFVSAKLSATSSAFQMVLNKIEELEKL
jgi:hypothetical protein